MGKLFVLVVLLIVPTVIATELTLVIKQIINNKEVVLNGTDVTTFLGDNLQFTCYLAFRNNSFANDNVRWQTQLIKENKVLIQSNGSPNVTIREVNYFDQGKYTCWTIMPLLYKYFYLNVDLSHYENNIQFSNVKFPKIEIGNHPLFNFKNFLEQPNLKVPDVHVHYNVSSNTITGFIIFFVIVIVSGVVLACYCLRSVSNASRIHLRSATCSHRFCANRRCSDPSAPCILQGSTTAYNEHIVVPPSGNEVIPQSRT